MKLPMNARGGSPDGSANTTGGGSGSSDNGRRSFLTSPWLLLLLTMLFWAGNVVIGRGMAETVPPVTLALLRWSVAFAVVLPIGWHALRRDWHAIRGAWRLMVLLALTGVTLFNTLYYVALTTTEATNAALVASTGPVAIPLVAWLLDRTRLGRAALIGLFIAMLGVLVIVVRGEPAALAELRIRQGDLVLLGAVTVWGIYSVLLRRKPANLSQLASLTVSFGLGLLMLIPPAIIEMAVLGIPRLDGPAVAAVLYVGTLPSVVAFFFWNKAVAEVGATRAGLFIYLIPVFSAALAGVFLGEAVHLYHLVGFVLIIAGIQVSTRTGPRTKRPA